MLKKFQKLFLFLPRAPFWKQTRRERRSRRHIWGSEIAKGFQTVKYYLLYKYSLQVFSPWKTQEVWPNLRAGGPLKGGSFWIFNIHRCKTSKNWRGTLTWFFFQKNLTMPKNWKRDPLRLFNIHSVAEHQKIEGGTLWGKFFFEKKSMPKKSERGDL